MRLHAFIRALGCLLGVLFALSAGSAAAAEDMAKPFATHKVVLQISDNNPFKQTLVLNVAHNLLLKYGTDQVAIEVVAFGPGLRLLFKDNPNEQRIASLVQSGGVRFSACNNTITSMTKQLGHKPVLDSQAVVVPGGVARILELEGEGYSLIKP